MDACEGPNSVLNNLLKLREREVEFVNALRDLIESNWRLKLQVEDLQKRLEDKETKHTEADKNIRSLRDVQTPEEQLELHRRNNQDVGNKANCTGSDHDIQAQEHLNQPAKSTSGISEPSSTKSPKSGQDTRRSFSQEVPTVQVSTEYLQVDEGGVDIDEDGEYIPKNEDIQSCSDDMNVPSPSKKRRKHKKTTVKKRNHTCDICSKSFWKITGLRAHQRAHGEKTSLRKSSRKPRCQLKVEEGGTRKSSSGKTHKCSECGKAFNTYSHLTAHHRVHTGERPYSCTFCEKAFTQKVNVASHEVTHASKDTPMPCPQCKVPFTSPTALRQHIADHRKENGSTCSKCDATFPSAAELRKHKAVHVGERPISCSYCDKKFRNMSGVKDHERTHTGEKPYLCHDCGRSFSCAQHLKTHRRTHTGEKPYACAECGESFAQKITLRKHQLRHTGERPHLCSLCGKAFARPEVLKTHQRVHTGEKPYSCNLCGQTFGYVQTLQSHQMRMHAPGEGTLRVRAETAH